MPSPPPLQSGVFYHVYNRGVNRANVFIEERNYHYFMRLYAKHIEPVAETYAYCLLKNHFHLLIRTRDGPDANGLKRPSASLAFSNFFNAYAKAINKAYNRTGSLFQHPFGRLRVETQSYLRHLTRYIHRNPQKHGLIGDFRDWPYSSYLAIKTLKVSETFRVSSEEVLEWFNGPTDYIAAHGAPSDEKIIAPLTPDDFD